MLLADAVDTAIRFVTAPLLRLPAPHLRLHPAQLVPLPYSRFLSAFQRFLYDVVNPFLTVFRRLLPMLRLGGMGLDLSPILAILALSASGGSSCSASSSLR